MNVVTVSLPDALDAQLESRSKAGGFRSKEDYLLALVRADCEKAEVESVLEERWTGLSRRSNQIGKNAFATQPNKVPEKTIERHPDVIALDLPGIYAFIAEHDAVAADRVLDAIEDTFQQIARYPECGAIYPSRNAKLKELRILPVIRYHNYLVFYRIEGALVRILYVVHGARHLVRLFKRESRA